MKWSVNAISTNRTVKKKNLDVYIAHPGLGDNLFFSHIPRLAKAVGYKTVSVHVPSVIYNSEKTSLIWGLNPYVDYIETNMQMNEINLTRYRNVPLLDSIAIELGLVDRVHNFEPEVFYKPKKSFSGWSVYDGNYISGAGLISSKKLLAHLKAVENIRYLKPLGKNYIPRIQHHQGVFAVKDLSEYFDLVATSDYFFSVVSGGASLRAAFGKGATVFYGLGQNELHRHSRQNKYIDVSLEIAPCINSFAAMGYRLFRKIKSVHWKQRQ